MPCPHNEITIVQRSQRQSAVAAAAYQSGEKLFCEYDQQVKHYPEKRGIVHNEILLPANAPQEYADRNTLWNAAEAVEKQWNSQLARRWVLTIPREIPPDQYAVLVREFCEQQFVSKGMMIQAYLDKYTGSMVCSKQLYKEALNHAFDEPKQWEIREINEIMNQCISSWRYFPNPRMFSEYGRQKGWERENPATDSGNPSEKTMDGFVEVTEQMELPF